MIGFHLRSEGDPIRMGFNVYPPSDKGSAGFVLRISKNRMIWFRYSRYLKKFYIRLDKLEQVEAV